uniref:protein-serine/threonine phosphatase n=1 Tax=Kalanchoe fedtschenkoi TaxID=63787 RepID=A0A7N0ZVV1_KALFE
MMSSSVHALLSDHQLPLKRSRVNVDSSHTRSAHPGTRLDLSVVPGPSLPPHPPAAAFSHSPTLSHDRRVYFDVDEENEEAFVKRAPSSYGAVSLIGRRRVMEDAITAAPPGLHEFFGVYDGHGGPVVSNACRERLHLILADEIAREETVVDWRRVMKACFQKMDEEVKGYVRRNGGGLVDGSESTGSTATVAMVAEEEIVVANCGDSKALVFSAGLALPLTRDHNPDLPDEGMRLGGGGGAFLAGLPVSRAIEPEVKLQARTPSDEFLIMASHGLWDVVSNEDACQVVNNCLDGQMKRSLKEDLVRSPAVAAATLAEFAVARGSKDNISIVIIDLS